MNKDLDLLSRNDNLIPLVEVNDNFHNGDDENFSLQEYDREEQENLFNYLDKSKGLKENNLKCSYENYTDKYIIQSNSILNIFSQCEDISYSLKEPNSSDCLNIFKIIDKENINPQILDNEKICKEIELKGEEENQSLKDKKGIIKSNSFIINNNINEKEDGKQLINGGKKKVFVNFKIFNPGSSSEDLKNIRNFINTIIFEKNKKKDKKNNLFHINKKKCEKEISITRTRKYKPDNIRKKIKARFLKALIIRINEELQFADSKKNFDLLPQCFISEINKKKNKEILNMTLREIITTNFFEKYKKKKKIKEDCTQKTNNNMLNKKRNNDCPPCIVKYNNNNEVIKYLENNKVNYKGFNFDFIGTMTFTELFNEYLESNEFEKNIFQLKFEEKEEDLYIKEYIINAFDFINIFSN